MKSIENANTSKQSANNNHQSQQPNSNTHSSRVVDSNNTKQAQSCSLKYTSNHSIPVSIDFLPSANSPLIILTSPARDPRLAYRHNSVNNRTFARLLTSLLRYLLRTHFVRTRPFLVSCLHVDEVPLPQGRNSVLADVRRTTSVLLLRLLIFADDDRGEARATEVRRKD